MDATLHQACTEARYFVYSVAVKPKLLKALLQLYKQLTKMTSIERSLYVADNQKQFTQLQSLLLQHSTTSKQRDPELVSFNDRIFKNLLNFNPQAPVNVPDIFANFVSGITYFAHEEDIHARPIYHRLYSCGERGDQMYETLHTCSDSQDPEARRIAEDRIYKCFLERMIFNDIYKYNTMFFPATGTETHGQDMSHKARLQKTYDDFKTCFPHMEIKIRIDYVQTTPRVLSIIKKIRGRISYTVVYTKDDINDRKAATKCIITKSSGVYLRISHFDNIGRLIKINGDTTHFTTLTEPYEQLQSSVEQ